MASASLTTALPRHAPLPARGGTRDAQAAARRREFAAVLALFRETAVLVPRRDRSWLTVDLGGVRWILAFSDESALARYALARGEGGAEWEYETVLGARLLDVAAPGAGVPCGVALDAADGPEHAVLFPPVAGVVPDAVAVDGGVTGDGEKGAAR
ncbi:SseB family protein [Streptomyces sp. NPDC004788]